MMMRAGLLAGLFVFAIHGGAAQAAPDPSVGDVIKALTMTPGAGRGSRPVVAAPATPGAAPQAAPAPRTPMPVSGEGSGAIDLSLVFASGQADLTPAARRTLDILGQALTSPELSGARLRLEGHTDTTGTREANMALSRRRAEAAVAYLQERHKIPAARIEAAGRGQDDLLVATGPNVDEPRNRRVHVVNIGR